MLAIYKFTLYKYAKSYSTWIILSFSAIVIGFLIGGMVPFVTLDITKDSAARNYVKSVIGVVSGITVFFAIFSAVFAAFKAATMLKDEVENGTFLVILSKPLRRVQIVFGKWFALQTFLLLYAFVSVLFLCIGVGIFDNGSKISGLSIMGVSKISSKIWYVGVFIFIILYITALIFSSLGIIISTKLSVGSTIGIVIAIGVYIPISGILGLFVRKSEAIPISANTNINTLVNKVDKQLNSPLGQQLQALDPDFSQLSSGLNKLRNDLSEDMLYQSVATDDKDSFQKIWWLDLDYQFKILSEYAYEKAIPEQVRGAIANEMNNFLPQKIDIQRLTQLNELFNFSSTAQASENQVIKFLTNWNQIGSLLTQATALSTLDTLFRLFDLKSLQEKKEDTSNNQPASFLDYEIAVPFDAINNTMVFVDDGLNYMKDPSHPSTPTNRLTKLISEFEAAKNNLVPGKTNLRFLTIENYIDWLDYLEIHRDLATTMRSLENTNLQATTPISEHDIFLQALAISKVKGKDKELQNFDLSELTDYEITNMAKVNVVKDEKWIRANLFSFYLTPRLLKDLNSQEISKENFATLNAATQNVYNPLQEVIFQQKSKNIFTALTDQKIEPADFEEVKRYFEIKTGNTNNFPPLSKADANLIGALFSAVENNKLAVSHIGSYANKSSVLIVYIVVALVLVPLAYFVVKRQDFR